MKTLLVYLLTIHVSQFEAVRHNKTYIKLSHFPFTQTTSVFVRFIWHFQFVCDILLFPKLGCWICSLLKKITKNSVFNYSFIEKRACFYCRTLRFGQRNKQTYWMHHKIFQKITVSAKIFFLLQGRLEIFPGRSVLGSAWVFWGRYTAQVAPQTAPYGLLSQTELQKFFSSNLPWDRLVYGNLGCHRHTETCFVTSCVTKYVCLDWLPLKLVGLTSPSSHRRGIYSRLD